MIDKVQKPLGKKLKILHICDKFGVSGSSVHGVSKLFELWFPRFNLERFDVSLAGLRKEDEAARALKRQGIKMINLGKGKFNISSIYDIKKLISEKQPDIVHLHGYGASNFGRIAAALAGTKTIVHEHFVDPNMPKYQIPFDYLLSRYTDLGIAVSNSVAEFMEKKRFINRDKIRIVFNGSPLDHFMPVDESIVMKERNLLSIPAANKIIGTICRLDEQKGISYFIDAAKILLKEDLDLRFLIVGDGPLMKTLKDKCQKLGIQEYVIFTGYYSDIRAIQSTFDVQVFSSLWEGTPLTVFEAMAMKRPIVSTNVDGLGEVLIHGENAVLVPPRDAKGLASAIADLIRNKNRANQLSSQAQRFSQDYDINKTVEKIENIYEELVVTEVH